MNVIDYALRLGKFLRKTPEGKALLQKYDMLEERYKDNESWKQFGDFVERKNSRYYFYAWDVAYTSFAGVIDDVEMEHRNLFLKTAEIVTSDDDIKELAAMAVEFGNIFEEIVGLVVTGGNVKNVIRPNWKYKIENSIEDIRIAVQRTMFTQEIAKCAQKHKDEFKSEAASEYCDIREKEAFLAYSDDAREFMQQYPNISDDYKRVIENIYLVKEVVKKGIFYGFWDQLVVINEEDLMDASSLTISELKEVTFTHMDMVSVVINKGWLYRINLESGYIYFLANHKVWHMDHGEQHSEVKGIVYPDQDKDFYLTENM